MSSVSLGDDGELVSSVGQQQQRTKNLFEDEDELDFEEEVDFGKSNVHADDDDEEEEGCIQDDNRAVVNKTNKQDGKKDKDEGELDDEDDLEEGEVKEEGEIESDEEDKDKTTNKPAPTNNTNGRARITAPDSKEEANNDERRRDFYRNPSHYQNRANYGGRIAPPYDDRGYDRPRGYFEPHGVARSGEIPQLSILPPPPAPFRHQAPAPESSWERGLKQVRDLLHKASKRKESESELESGFKQQQPAQYNLTSADGKPIKPVLPESAGSDYRSRRSPLLPPPPEEKRRRLSGAVEESSSSSEDEVERRHRLAFDAAPWNNSSDRNRNTYFANRSSGGPDSYRDPWMRSRSPARAGSHSRSRREMEAHHSGAPPADGGVLFDRYGNPIRRTASSTSGRSVPAEATRHGSSSISSMGSPDVSPEGRRLPYERPSLSRSRYDRDREPDYRRMDRIPKKSNAMQKRGSADKSYDSWSASLSSESDSSSFSDSDDKDDSPRRTTSRSRPGGSSKKTRAPPPPPRSRSRSKEVYSGHHRVASSSSPPSTRLDGRSIARDTGNKEAPRLSRYDLEKQAIEKQQQPIKMTFLKTKSSIQKDRLIDERFNGDDLSDESGDDFVEDDSDRRNRNGSNSRTSIDGANVGAKLGALERDDEDVEAEATNDVNREELLNKLRDIEEAIERKLQGSKKD